MARPFNFTLVACNAYDYHPNKKSERFILTTLTNFKLLPTIQNKLQLKSVIDNDKSESRLTNNTFGVIFTVSTVLIKK